MAKTIMTITVPQDAVAHRDPALKWAAENDPTRFRSRTVRPKKGKGRKRRPRNSNRVRRQEGE